MAAAGMNIDSENFSCSICLDLMKDPVTIPCGHSYCMSCVNAHWDGEVGKQSYSCPQCRQSFTQRPVLVKNTMLAVLMEGLQKSGAPAAVVCPSSAAHGEVFCDLCSGKKMKAFKSCLQCLVSYCKDHLQPHYDVAALKKHKLVEPTENLQDNICSRHDEVMKMFCRTDQQCICYLCSVDQHKGHDTVTAAAERAEKQEELHTFKQNILRRINHKHKDMVSLQHQLKSSSRSADAALQLSDRNLKELVQLLEKRINEVKQQIRTQQEAEEHRVKDLQNKLQQQISELQIRFTELDTLSHTEDHVQFLHKFVSLPKVSETSDSLNITQSLPPFQDMVTAAVSKLKSSLQETSLMDPSAVAHKSKVNTPKTNAHPAGTHATSQQTKTDAFPSGAQAMAKSQHTSQTKGCTVTLPSQSLQPQPIQGDVPPPPQNSEDTSPLDFAAMVHKLKENNPMSDGHPEGIQLITPPDGSSYQEWSDYIFRTFTVVPFGITRVHPRNCSGPPPPLQDTEAWPALARQNLRLKNPPPFSASPSTPYESNYEKLKKYACKITWDPRSLHDELELSDDNVCVRRMPYSHNYRPHAFRFTNLPQVVSKQTLTRQCYFEVSCTNVDKGLTVGVAYKDIRREGSSNESSFGMNSKSWALECFNDHSVFWHNGNKVERPVGGTSAGVFVDCEAGVLSFYRKVVDMEHIYTVKTTFTQPLVAAARLDDVGGDVKLDSRMFSTHN